MILDTERLRALVLALCVPHRIIEASDLTEIHYESNTLVKNLIEHINPQILIKARGLD